MTANTINDAVTIRGGSDSSLGWIDQYELLRELGGGGFGTVYLARDTVAGIEVAVKGLPPMIRNNAEELERIRENFALISRLHHPYIAAALVLHPAKEVIYRDPSIRQKLRVDSGDTLMVMEYAPGVTLSRWRKQFPGGKVPLEPAIQIVWQIAQALDFAHEQHIIHRDIKPSNIMVETKSDGEVVARLLDFGLAAEIRSSMGRVSREIHDTSGTRPYMAPEQWAGRKQGPATDQYALAVLLYEMLTGEVPFASVFDTGDPMVMMNAVCNQDAEIPEDCPRKMALRRALAKDPSQRFANCMEFIETAAKSDTAQTGGGDVSRGTEEKHGRRGVRAVPVVSVLCIAAIAISLVTAGGWWWKIGRAASSAGVTHISTVAEAKAKAERDREEAAAKARAEQYKRELVEAEVTERDRKEEAAKPTAPKTKTITLPGGATMEMIYVAPGTFTMGSPKSEAGRRDDEMLHQVTLTKGFWLGKYEVTQKQWYSVMEALPCGFTGNDCPVVNVSWYDCQDFAQKINEKLKCGARLPTEAEWEYACRAGSMGAHCGTGNLKEMGWYRDNSGNKVHPVGQRRANAWGFYDMHGNVYERCQDWYGNYKGDVTDPQGPVSGDYRVLRGASWNDYAINVRAANRHKTLPGFRCVYDGFRLCCSLIPSEVAATSSEGMQCGRKETEAGDNIHTKVQLWAGGPYWADTNIGAKKPWEYGYYFWWGDTLGYKRQNGAWVASNGSSSNFSFGEAALNDNKGLSMLQSGGWITADNVLTPEHDAAHVHWGGEWRMPTDKEMMALIKNCNWKWTTMNGVRGYVVSGKNDYSSSKIFLPASGFADRTSLRYASWDGYAWSSVPSINHSSKAWGFFFRSDVHRAGCYNRYTGQPVRPVQGFTADAKAKNRLAESTSVIATQATVSNIKYKYNYSIDKQGYIHLWGKSGHEPCISPKPEGTFTLPTEIDGHKVIQLGWHAFAGCDKLTTFIFPKDVVQGFWIDPYIFRNCPKLRRVLFQGDAPGLHVPPNTDSKGRNIFSFSAPDIVVEVKKGTKGWKNKNSTELPPRWPTRGYDSRPIRYIQ